LLMCRRWLPKIYVVVGLSEGAALTEAAERSAKCHRSLVRCPDRRHLRRVPGCGRWPPR
jgi:hypothetical protein